MSTSRACIRRLRKTNSCKNDELGMDCGGDGCDDAGCWRMVFVSPKAVGAPRPIDARGHPEPRFHVPAAYQRALQGRAGVARDSQRSRARHRPACGQTRGGVLATTHARPYARDYERHNAHQQHQPKPISPTRASRARPTRRASGPSTTPATACAPSWTVTASSPDCRKPRQQT